MFRRTYWQNVSDRFYSYWLWKEYRSDDSWTVFAQPVDISCLRVIQAGLSSTAPGSVCSCQRGSVALRMKTLTIQAVKTWDAFIYSFDTKHTQEVGEFDLNQKIWLVFTQQVHLTADSETSGWLCLPVTPVSLFSVRTQKKTLLQSKIYIRMNYCTPKLVMGYSDNSAAVGSQVGLVKKNTC